MQIKSDKKEKVKLTPEQRAAAIELLWLNHEWERRQKENPLRYVRMHPKQEQFHKTPQPTRALFWGNRVGKTEIGAIETARYLQGKHEYREINLPVEVWSICPSFDAQSETTQKKLLTYLPENEIADKTYIRKGILSTLTLKNGSKISFKSYEQGREKFQGAGKRLIWFDEEPPKDIYQECIVRQEAGQPLDVILTMTPIKGMTWVYDEIYLSTDTNLYFVSTAGWDDNPFLTDHQKDIMARGLTPEALAVRKEGKFTKRVGLVCNWFDRNIHIRDYKTDDLDNMIFYEVLDGGYSDPSAYLLIGIDNNDTVHIVDGFRERYLQTNEIKKLRDARTIGLHIRSGFCDNDNPRLQQELSKMGMRLKPISKKTMSAVRSWDEYLAETLAEYGSVQKGTGEPRLYISSKLLRYDENTGSNSNWLLQEIENLSWLESSVKGVSEQKPVWDDHRRFGHHFDGIRALAYFLVSYKKGSYTQSYQTIHNNINDDPYSKNYSEPFIDKSFIDKGVL